jgi:hypothetical protein
MYAGVKWQWEKVAGISELASQASFYYPPTKGKAGGV